MQNTLGAPSFRAFGHLRPEFFIQPKADPVQLVRRQSCSQGHHLGPNLIQPVAEGPRDEGVIQPLVLSVQARAAGRHQQGAVVGLRETGQRFTSILVPPIMGTIVDRFGVSASFLIIGGVMLLLCTSVALIIRRIGRRGSLDESLAGATD
jgi:hypothetical protein